MATSSTEISTSFVPSLPLPAVPGNVNAKNYGIPDDELPHLPCAIQIFQDMVEDPPKYTCSLSLGLYEDPVMDLVGQTYERKDIQLHLELQRQQQKRLTSPLSNEPLEAPTLIPNRAMKSDVATYKTEKAQRCFALAKECLNKNCGESALILLGRVKQLSPQLEGLASIEEKAKETFISDQRRKEAYISRAEKALQERDPQKALQLLKPFQKALTYSLRRSMEPTWVINGEIYVGTKSHYLVTIAPGAEYVCKLWDIRNKTILSTCKIKPNYVSYSKGDMDILTETVISVSFPGYNPLLMFTNGKAIDLRPPEEVINVTPCGREYMGYTPKSGKMIKQQWFNPVVIISSGKMIGWVTTQRCYKVECRYREEWKKVGDEFLETTLIDATGNARRIDNTTVENQENQRTPIDASSLQIYFPEKTETSSKDPDPADLSDLYFPDQWKATGEGKLCMDKYVPDISSNTEPGEIKFHVALLRAAILQGDFDSFIHAIEYLIGYHFKAGTWSVLEEMVLIFNDNTELIRDRLRKEMGKASVPVENVWFSRLHLFLGLLLQPTGSLKFVTYKKGLEWNPNDKILITAIEYTERHNLDKVDQLQTQVQDQQQQIEKLRELVQTLLGSQKNTAVNSNTLSMDLLTVEKK